MLDELLNVVEPLLQGFHDISISTGQRMLPQVPKNPPMERTSFSSVVERKLSQS